ncbi:Crp/Fnr family transcriptional regulator [Marinifilum caeruleilacunae]|uniref:Crp/Fnr family transcriptional regulator n=1 Tax=Marinifilum caeruleilacunae TaxID=2499076 RepID=A0ABX1X143_9BACT|nr:Crp/Fnr family transcriptional regulator [Marinifilum caeruleilacunae]NOU62129.1 Crp/Fnr family transcriptional regulator [Marinifilum caeruleilacunae]
MENDNNVIRFFRRNFTSQLSKEDEKRIFTYFKRHKFEKKQLVFMSGDINTDHFFIENGLMRLFLIDKTGKEFNLLFANENQIIGDLITPEPTDFNLEAVEKTTAYSISERNFQELIQSLSLTHQSNPQNSLRRSYIKIQKRLVSILANTAEENYLEFRKTYPELIQRLPQYHIASYLGVSAEFLSKIIARTVKK